MIFSVVQRYLIVGLVAALAAAGGVYLWQKGKIDRQRAQIIAHEFAQETNIATIDRLEAALGEAALEAQASEQRQEQALARLAERNVELAGRAAKLEGRLKDAVKGSGLSDCLVPRSVWRVLHEATDSDADGRGSGYPVSED